jgi:hypothetical protein
MTLKTIFNKPVDRPIEGVIKADDEASLRLEFEEYVLTNEVEQRLMSFLDAYNNYAGANGVWISGFFGSGKSHLLKILALLLENRHIDGATALELFLPKCGENAILRGDLKRAVEIPSKSILFNIDQKADVISKTQIDALVAVFVKVFDEMCGYFGKQGYIAQFERDLDSRGMYERFKSAYESIAGKSWLRGREQALLEAKNIAGAYAQATGSDEAHSAGILDKYRTQYHVSIEDFAEWVNAYIESQPAGFRLNFFVDEVGQYVAENVKLMTNLQTIAESLATKCRGRAWVVVTSQNDMSTVLGEMNKQQTNDFSKIMARFNTKMLLTSTNVAEVIQKRLLAKTDDGAEVISDLFHRHSNNFGTLFSFTDGSRAYKPYRDRDEFIRCYPFVPYQFDLFQAAIENLSRQNAFEGKHSSVGERSMLGVFQQVAIHTANHEIGQLAAFDLMFEGIQTALKAQTQRAVLAARQQLTSPFAVRVLKALFLVKYVKEFKSTVRNLCILMLDDFNQNVPALRAQVEAALSLLEQQTYVQRNGELYEYLTDEEKDVEQEIKNTEVESTEVAAELERIVFDHVIKHHKIRYDENGKDYSFSRKLDNRLQGREHELAIHVVSPFHDAAVNESTLLMQSMGRDELLVVMQPDERLVRDILMYKRTEKYIRQNTSISQQEAVGRILNDKGFHNRERYMAIQQRAQELVSRARIFIEGSEIETATGDARSRIVSGFQELITRAYPNLRMLRGITYTENDIARCLEQSQQGLFGNDATSLTEPEQELLAFIQSNSRGGVRTTLKGLLEKFERKPYGWPYAVILCTVACLCGRGKLEVRRDSNLLEENELEQALRNTHGHAQVVLDPQVEFTASQVRALKDFFEDFFDTPPCANEAKALGKETGLALQELIHQLAPLNAQTAQYPFLSALGPVIDKLQEHSTKPYTWYLTELVRQEDSLLGMKEGVIDPIRKFMGGPQKAIFDTARKFVQAQEANFPYIEGDDASEVAGCLIDPECFKGNRMQQVKEQVEALQQKVSDRVKTEIAQAGETVRVLKERLCAMGEFGVLTGDQQEQIVRVFNEVANNIERQKLIAVIRDSLRRFEDEDYHHLLSQMTDWAQPQPAAGSAPATGGDTSQVEGDPVPLPPFETRVEYVPSRSVQVSFDKAWLADEDDVNRYLESMRQALMEEIHKGKRIQV